MINDRLFLWVFLFDLLKIACTYIQTGCTPLDKCTVYFYALRYGM